MKRQAPGGYEHQGPQHHQVWLQCRVEHVLCTLCTSEAITQVQLQSQQRSVGMRHGCTNMSALLLLEAHTSLQGYGGAHDNGVGPDQDGYGVRNKQRRT
jgi:hypothetical protein